MKREFIGLILAAGKGTRFKSDRIKLLHPLLGRTMLGMVLDCIKKLGPQKMLVVVGHQQEDVVQEAALYGAKPVVQAKQLGTGHAVLSAKKALASDGEKDVLVVNGDLPLLRPETLRPFLNVHRKQGNSLTFFSAELPDPTGFGRLIQPESGPMRIVEEKDATPRQRKIREVNAGIYLAKVKDLFQALPRLSNKNKKGEYYLTDIIEVMGELGKKVGVYKSSQTDELIGVNDRFEMAQALSELRMRKIKELCLQGVTIQDPATTWIDWDVRIARESTIHPYVVIEGDTKIGANCSILPFVHIISCTIGRECRILTSTMIEESILENRVQVGPFTHFRPGTVIRSGAKVGNFVEMKKTVFGRGSKAGHLSYIGDAEVADDVNIGAGTITCNYDGVQKYKTIIERGVFIGSGTELVAPVRIGREAYVGAGSTITKDVSPNALAISRVRQSEKPGWAKKRARKKK
ncbi:MAG: bifunctional UDP-N-acetylglucosamine diphosphorylase/glucosamine-1-phosphate N-acetyltransferase GlmU [Candidatus Aminicenantes bacterium]|nr:bifunctional UDP-N-acetylglucosamine diphosphorylase/glucosamine-1-phosphate N-acetyltransferase GlmU [Candidatus Aminicenantes bacterium]